jgi:hypothetical protein
MKLDTLDKAVIIAGIVVLLFLGGVVIASSEAKVLPAGTLIIMPDGEHITLDAVGFLLTRDDMERATTALAQQPVDAKTILDLQTLSDKQERELRQEWLWRGVTAVVGLLSGIAFDHYALK